MISVYRSDIEENVFMVVEPEQWFQGNVRLCVISRDDFNLVNEYMNGENQFLKELQDGAYFNENRHDAIVTHICLYGNNATIVKISNALTLWEMVNLRQVHEI